jgi:5-methylcytosine-specific restriction endonuclease McrA
MEPFWFALAVIFGIYKVYQWDQSNKRLNEYRRVRSLQASYGEIAAKEYPDLVGKYWNPKRNPVSLEIRPKILARTKGHCYYCDKNLNASFDWQVDHIWPYRYGGSEDLVNLVPSCKSCNGEKWSHLPPRFFLHKWVVGTPFTVHELKFIEYHRDHSMAHLISTSAHWKGKTNYWLDHVYTEFADLITANESIKNTSGKRREELLAKSYSVYKKLDCDIAGKRYSSYRVIEKWIGDKKFFEEMTKNLEKDQ